MSQLVSGLSSDPGFWIVGGLLFGALAGALIVWAKQLPWATAAPVMVVLVGTTTSALGTVWLVLTQSATTREILSQVAGGDSFVYLQPLRLERRRINASTVTVSYFVRQAGDYPTFDVVVRIQEIVMHDGRPRRRFLYGPREAARTIKSGSGYDWTFPDPVPWEPQQWPLVFQEPPPPGSGERRFRVELMARNGIFIQRLRVWPSGDRWHTESRTLRRSGVGPLSPPAFDEAQSLEILPAGRLEEDTEDR